MKLQIYSDLHNEFVGHYEMPLLGSDIIILAGDIDAGMDGIE
ncbi:MAG: hypothetical protein P1P93_10260 [Gammaproteobacteria bacterium]|nr:hypothetical protein [Gammaproteobacteria bacterium]